MTIRNSQKTTWKIWKICCQLIVDNLLRKCNEYSKKPLSINQLLKTKKNLRKKFHTVNWKTQNSFNTVSDAVNSDGQTGCKKEENSLFSPLLKLCNSPIRFDFSQFKMSKLNLEMVFCYQNCPDLLWEKIVLVIEICKNFEITRHPGQDWFIIHVKLGHSMDNGFIFKRINKN